MEGNWAYLIIITCIILAAVFVWQEVKRASKHWLPWRVAAVVMACTALACIVLPLSYQSVINKSGRHKTVLLTPGFDAGSLTGKNVKAFTFDEGIKQKHPQVQLIKPGELNSTDELYVYGYGLNDDELQQLGGRPIVFNNIRLPAGVTGISYNGELKAGEELHVQGNYNNTSTQKIKLVLRGLNTTLDSITIGPNAQTAFDLATIPKATGRQTFTLQAGTAIQGTLPIQVNTVKPLNILMLAASPDFETRFLKNWLAGNGYAVAARSTISKDKFNTEYINISQFPFNRLSASVLHKFDVLISELSVLNALSSAETAALKQEVADNGLGIIVKADSAGKTSWLQNYFPVYRPSVKEPPASMLLINGKKSSANKLNNGSAYIIYQNGTQPLVSNIQNHVLASSIISGAGKVVYTTLNNTFSWVLAGHSSDYAALWSAMITKAARKDKEADNKITTSSIAVVNEPVQLQLKGNKQPPVITNGEHTAPMQNLNIPFERGVTYWPWQAGWQATSHNNKVNWWYAHPKTDWQGIKAAAKIAATKKYAGKYIKPGNVTKQIQQKVRINVPKIYFYILLLAACTFLWIEARFS